MRKSSSSSVSSSKKQTTINMADSQKQQNLSSFEQQKKDQIAKKQKQMIEALQNQIDISGKTKQERFQYLQDILSDSNLGKDFQKINEISVQFFETNPQENNKLQVDYDQINTALNTIKATRRDTKRKEVYKESPCASIGANEVKQRMNIINPDFPQEEIQIMFPPRKEANSKELFELLRVNQIQKDPLAEALKMFVDQNGELNKIKLNTMMKYLGYGQIDNKEMNILKDILDIDQDGKITQEDLKEVFSSCNKIYTMQQKNKTED